MAKPTTDTFGNFKIWVGGDGDIDPDVDIFTAPCGFTQKALTLTGSASTTLLADCDDEEAPAWEEAGITALSAAVSGNGVLAEEADDTWLTWWSSGQSRNVRVERTRGYWKGKAVVLELGESVQLGSEGNRIQRAVSLRNAGEWVWVPASAS